jgi:putative flippase GtrA
MFIFKKQIYRQFFKFCLVGLMNTAIDFSVYLFFSRTLGLYFLYANILAILLAMTFSFWANKYWTFQNNEKKIKLQYLKFALVNLVYFLLYNSIFFSLVEYFKLFDLTAKIAAIMIGLFWNFFANRYWTFSTTTPAPSFFKEGNKRYCNGPSCFNCHSLSLVNTFLLPCQ